MGTKETVVRLMEIWLSNQKHQTSVEEIAQAYLDFETTVTSHILPSESKEDQ